ncbi:MAG: glutamate synthase large subunit [Deltaproteobacteria bacterium]|nr:glutamate synthase large subunit [Deltaproteobacteria bacterium]
MAERRDNLGLYDPSLSHGSCGVGLVCRVDGTASHGLVSDALTMIENMEHRGATGAEPESGDGAGIMVLTPDAFLRRACGRLGIELPPAGQYAVGMVFLPRDDGARRECETVLEDVVSGYGMKVLGWRHVPVDHEAVGPTPRKTEPVIRQVFVRAGDSFYNRADFDRRLYLVRQRAENVLEFGGFSQAARDDFYVCVFSANRLVYKGMLTAPQLRRYYRDLAEPDFESSLAVVHSRFSTNTLPSWRLAHPFRYVAHNGEINTLRGNRNWMRARYAALRSEVFGEELQKMYPLLTESGSDSATLDNMLQLLCVNGRSLPHAVRMLIPEAWQNDATMDPDLRAFYEYHACLMEPWDGPATIVFSNGSVAGAVLDRNGLRPSRYWVTDDGVVVLASETGVLPIAPERIVRKGRVRPGRVFMIDLRARRIVEDAEVKRGFTDLRPWRRWLDGNLIDIDKLPEPGGVKDPDHETLLVRQHAFGYTLEELRLVINPMASRGDEPVGSMGNDTPLACLSERPRLLYDYFKQLFAQVTNPPLDAIREEIVTSLVTYLGRERNLLSETPAHCRLIRLAQPILSNADLEKVRQVSRGDLRAVTLSMTFPVCEAEAGLERATGDLCRAAAAAVAGGASILILSDRGVDREHAPIPALLATAAVHNHLIREGTRTQCGLVVETGDARETHHFCLLVGYGASAVNPYVAFETVDDMHREGLLPDGLSKLAAEQNFIRAANKAILKVASKMGISTIQSYRGAQIFEAVGLGRDFVDRYFTHTPSRIGGVGLDVIAKETLVRHRRGYPPAPVDWKVLDSGGRHQWRRDGEHHAWNPDTIALLRHAARTGRPEAYEEFARAADGAARGRTLRGLFRFRDAPPVPIDEVEPAGAVVRRFVTGAMSFGSISREAHECLAVAMNRLGGKSNSGEGGEDRTRYAPGPGGQDRRSAVKQVASARFGVTAEYLVNADEIQIKISQGAKPGEGGQLPGHKVDAEIARVRHSTPGVGLISPPPHHDIYSIEDLAQLILDLRHVNPAARISVKLVSEVGVGTVAAGVAKARADHILISGGEGGTGASPLTSTMHAGLPWELGLAETQQALCANRLRGRVTLQVDGQLKTGRDVVVAAMLGAEEFGFATGALVALGCIMMRVCHLNTCPAGIATQDPELRRNFGGAPEHLINYLTFVAQDVRKHMARLGIRRFDDLVGRTDLLEPDTDAGCFKARYLDLAPILESPAPGGDAPRQLRRIERQDGGLARSLDIELLARAAPALDRGERVEAELAVRNVHRSVGAMLSGEVARRFGHEGLPDGAVTFNLCGSAGQSFGAFLAHGLTLRLEGDANDYLGKGLSGGRIVAVPPRGSTFRAEDNVIAGNVAGYGATAGEMFIRGRVGERFCVRNSGAVAVVEGVGDHGCEYMTGGRVLVLGPAGRNFAAGMSGGVAYVFDPDGAFAGLCNTKTVAIETPDTSDLDELKAIVSRHREHTGSAVAKAVLADWECSSRKFAKVMPHDLKTVLDRQAEAQEKSRLQSRRRENA